MMAVMMHRLLMLPFGDAVRLVPLVETFHDGGAVLGVISQEVVEAVYHSCHREGICTEGPWPIIIIDVVLCNLWTLIEPRIDDGVPLPMDLPVDVGVAWPAVVVKEDKDKDKAAMSPNRNFGLRLDPTLSCRY